MKTRSLIIRWSVLALTVSFLAMSSKAKAQLYENNCYFPHFGKPGEIDTVYGSYAGQQLGSDVFNPGPFDKYPHGKIFVQGLVENPLFLSSIDPKPPFDLHSFQIQKKQAFNRYNFTGDFAHLRDSKHWDFYCRDNEGGLPRIYWADDEGNYDSVNVTYLALPPQPRRIYDYFMNDGIPCVGHFTSDTICDLLFAGGYATYAKPDTNANYLILFNGGSQLYNQGDTAFCDSLVSMFELSQSANFDLGRHVYVANWRNKTSDDIIGISNDDASWFFYKNEHPFSLAKFWTAMQYDTLFAKWENPKAGRYLGAQPVTFFSQSIHDSVQDLICSFDLTGSDHFTQSVYRGGKDFGAKRLLVDSSDFIFHTPRWYSSQFFGFGMSYWPEFVGDMTGTGNPVYRIFAGIDQTSYEFYYVMGAALNDHVDMSYRPEPDGIGNIATLDVDGDGKMDVLEGNPLFETSADFDKGKMNVGLLALIHGSDRIPVNLNPQFAVKERHDVDHAPNHIVAYPNPSEEKTVLTFDNCSSSRMRVQVYSVNGELVYQEETPAVDGLQQFSADLSSIPAGMYVIRLTCPALGWTGSVNIIKTGAAQTSRSFDLKKMVGR